MNNNDNIYRDFITNPSGRTLTHPLSSYTGSLYMPNDDIDMLEDHL